MGYYSNIPQLGGSKLYSDLDLNGHNIVGAGGVAVAGGLTGQLVGIRRTGATVNLTSGDLVGQLHYAAKTDGAMTYNLPPVVVGGILTIMAETEFVLTINPDDADRIIINGVAKADGVTIVSTGEAGEQVTLVGDSSAGWTVIGKGGNWT